MPALEFRDVRKGYDGKQAVDGVSFEVRAGEVFGLVGPNGAGKTTLMRMAMDIIRPDSGVILIDGRPSPEADHDRIGYLPEERGLYRKQKVIDVLDYFGRLKGLDGATARARARDELARAGLAEWEKKRVEHLSKGMQQKVQVIGALLHRPDIVILDEPFSGLDPVNVRLVKDMIADLRARGALVVLSTHVMAQVEEMCDRIAMIHQGRLVLYGGVQEILRRYSAGRVVVKEVLSTSLEEIFVRVVRDDEAAGAGGAAGAGTPAGREAAAGTPGESPPGPGGGA